MLFGGIFIEFVKRGLDFDSAPTMFLSLAIWLQNTVVFRFLRESDHDYEILLALHVSSIALFAASLVITDLRLLGWALRGHSIQSVVSQMRVPNRIGFLCVATFGFLMFGIEAEEYYYNVFFRTKVLLFLLLAACTDFPSTRVQPGSRAFRSEAGGCMFSGFVVIDCVRC